MNTSNTKTLIASAVALAILTLTGCGDSTSSNQATLSAPPADTKTIISIGNETSQTFARAVLLDQNGNSIKTQEIDCRPAATGCMMFLPNDVQQTATLIVQDKQGHMVGAFRFPNKLQSYNAAYPNSLTTGIYLTNRLVRDYLLKDGVSWPNARQKLEIFFSDYDSPDGSADLFEELGDYYAKRMATNPTSENEFLEALKKRLMAGDVAKPEELPTKTKKHAGLNLGNKIVNAYNLLKTGNVSLISAAHAQQPSEGCPTAVQTYLSWVNNMAGTIPVVGDAVAGVAGFAGELCAPDTNAKIDQMLSKLTTLQTSVNEIANSLGVLQDFVNDSAINNETLAFQKIEKSARNDVAKYKTFLSMHKVNSLDEYIKDWDVATKENPVLLEILRAPNTTLVDMKDLSKNATFNTYTTALNNRCSNLQQNRPGVNFVNVRQGCNNNIIYNTALLAGTQQMLSPMLTDIYKVLTKFNNDPKVGPTKVFNKIGIPTGIITDYSQANAQIKTFYNNELDTLLKKFQTTVGNDQKGFFDLYAGLNKTMQANLVARECHGLLAERKKFPAISGWFSPSGSNKDNYIETECQEINADNNTKRPVKARYYYTNQGTNVDANDVANVLGVPVAMHYVKTGEAFNKSVISEYAGMQSVVFTAPKLVSFNNDSSAGKINGVVPQKDIKDLNYVLHSMITSSGLQYTAKIPQSRGSGRTWVSFNKDGVNGVVSLTIEYNTYSATSEKRDDSYFYLRCVTEDCRVEPTQSQWLSFRNGMNVDISDLKKNQAGAPLYQLGPLQ